MNKSPAPWWLKYLNFLLLQWFFVRLIYATGPLGLEKDWRGWQLTWGIVPLTGWWGTYRRWWRLTSAIWSPDIHAVVKRLAFQSVKLTDAQHQEGKTRAELLRVSQTLKDFRDCAIDVLTKRAEDYERYAGYARFSVEKSVYKNMALNLRVMAEKFDELMGLSAEDRKLDETKPGVSSGF